MKTNEVIKQYGITRKALQVYEKKGLFSQKEINQDIVIIVKKI